MKHSRQNLIIVARFPQLGSGKRRLAADIGNVGALWFQRHAIARLKRKVGQDPRWRGWLAISPDRPIHWTQPCTPIPQGSGDLGTRLARVVRAVPHGPVVVIGSDAPQVSTRHIATAFTSLRRADAVFGPSVDGGFWLMGLRQPCVCQPFAKVRWSSANTLSDVIRNLAARKVSLLGVMEDVDDGASLTRLRAMVRRN